MLLLPLYLRRLRWVEHELGDLWHAIEGQVVVTHIAVLCTPLGPTRPHSLVRLRVLVARYAEKGRGECEAGASACTTLLRLCIVLEVGVLALALGFVRANIEIFPPNKPVLSAFLWPSWDVVVLHAIASRGKTLERVPRYILFMLPVRVSTEARAVRAHARAVLPSQPALRATPRHVQIICDGLLRSSLLVLKHDLGSRCRTKALERVQ